MYPQNSGGWSKFPGRLKLRPSIAQTAFVRVVTPRKANVIKISFIGFVFELQHQSCQLQNNPQTSEEVIINETFRNELQNLTPKMKLYYLHPLFVCK